MTATKGKLGQFKPLPRRKLERLIKAGRKSAAELFRVLEASALPGPGEMEARLR